MNRLKYLLLMILFIPFSVNADSMYNLDMNIYIGNDGTANVTETWDVKASGGSEWYKSLKNLGNMEISNFTVSMDGNKLTEKKWDVDESLSEKKGYYGINQISDGIELCFGKSDMKRHTFTLSYTMSNFIFNTSDSQVLYATLFPNVTADNFTVKVSSYYKFPDTLDVWGYGYKGYAYVQDGVIKMSNEGDLDEEYVVLLAKFPLNTFNTSNSYSIYESFNDVYNAAEENTFEYDYDDNGSSGFASFISTIIDFLIPLVIFIVPVVFAVLLKGEKYGYRGNKKIDKNNTPMFRDIPCNKDIYYANALISLNNFGYNESNIFGAIILKWVRMNKIVFRNATSGIFNKETSTIDLTLNPSFDNELEKELFDMMFIASKDGVLEAKELEKWCKNNYSKFFSLFEKIKNGEINKLKASNHIYKRTSKEECKQKNVMDDVIYKDSTQLYGLKLFLQEFSRIDTKEVMEVHIWDEYLMFAYLFGIADKVAKQLKNLYPEVINEGVSGNGTYFDYNTILFINSISASSVSAASSARSAAESYTSGGGGFSSGGGGGGSFGGGGSMGGR